MARLFPEDEIDLAVRNALEYDPVSGRVLKAISNTPADTCFMRCFKLTYRRVYVPKYGYLLAHRVAYFLFTGGWPDQIDHEDGDGTNNSWSNIRSVSHLKNMQNRSKPSHNTSGVVGVYRHGNRWRAMIGVDGKLKHIGTYPTFDEAVKARQDAAKGAGYHSNHGRTRVSSLR